MFDDYELHESIQAFREMGAEIELQPILAHLAAMRARTIREDSAEELQVSIQPFRAMGAEIELQPILAHLAAMRARTIREGNAVQRQQPTAPGPSLSLSNRLKVAA